MIPKVSIVVPCYKQAHFLDQTLQSVVNQTFVSWECIIVNDGSPDNTEEVAQQWSNRDSRFHYIHKKNGGLPAARNSGIAMSKGTFILPLDSDDILHEDYLNTIIPYFEQNIHLEVVSCYRMFFSDHIEDTFYEHKPFGKDYHSLLFENILMPSSVYKKSSWERVGGYDESMRKGFEDWEFWISILKDGGEFKVIERSLFYYRKSKVSMLTNTLAHHAEDVSKYVYKKHREIYIDKFDTTMDYLFYLIKKHRLSEDNLKTSLEYKIGKVITKPFKLIKGLLRSKK